MGNWSKAEETFINCLSNKATDGTKEIGRIVLNEIKEVIKEGKQIFDYDKFVDSYIKNHCDFDYNFMEVSQFLYDCLDERFYQVYISFDDTERELLYNDALARANPNKNEELSREAKKQVKDFCDAFYLKYRVELKNKLSIEAKTILDKTGKGFSTLTKQLNIFVDNFQNFYDEIPDKMIDRLIERGFLPPDRKLQDIEYYTANGLYYRSYINALFLHTDNKNVTLKNTFVLQKYTKDDNTYDDLESMLIEYLNSKDEKLLCIQGDAGSGKSSLVSWLNYHYTINDETGKALFNGKNLVTIRLRDLNKEALEKSKSLYDEIFKYTKTFNEYSSDNQIEFNKKFPNAVIVLDGYDELCLINNTENMLDELQYLLSTHKVIVTTRPRYAEFSNYEKVINIYLKHFDKKKRNQWIEKYKNICKQDVDKKVEAYITNINDEDSDGVCDTPMMLYMLCANGKSLADNLDNSWEIFNKVFYNVITETEYNRSLAHSHFHHIYTYKDCIYKVNEEIAYRMYKSGNRQLYFNNNEIEEIVKGITDDVSAQEITKRSYALCSYWNISTEDGAIEFYHNNIRDFFLCEKIYRTLNKLYTKFRKLTEILSQDNIQEIINTLCNLFHYDIINNKVLEFIQLRAKSEFKNEKTGFAKIEYDNKLLPQFFEIMLTDGTRLINISNDAQNDRMKELDEIKEKIKNFFSKNPIQTMRNIYFSIINLYIFAYQPYLKKEEKIKLYKDVKSVNDNWFLNDVLNMNNSRNKICLANADLSGIYLRCVDLHFADLSNVNLSFAQLSGTNLSNAILINSDLCNADLSNVDLRFTQLSRAKLSNAILNNSDLRNADLSDVDLSFAQLSRTNLSNAILCNSDLSNSKINGANLSNSDFSFVNLRNTVLPNGFSNNLQNIQKSKLKEISIKNNWNITI